MRVPCPRYYEELARVKDLPEVLETLSQLDLDEMSEYLSTHANMTIDNPDDVQSLYNTLLGEVGFLILDLHTLILYVVKKSTVAGFKT